MIARVSRTINLGGAKSWTLSMESVKKAIKTPCNPPKKNESGKPNRCEF
ncbi:MAG: hypothetical protein LBU73_05795 [Helicobacteraceae bacterium]|nr:hypothetical protein [Helicobacteraceae bacterium]